LNKKKKKKKKGGEKKAILLFGGSSRFCLRTKPVYNGLGGGPQKTEGWSRKIGREAVTFEKMVGG